MAQLDGLVNRLEKVTARLEKVVLHAGTPARDEAGAADAPYVVAFDTILNGPVEEYVRLSKDIGGDVEKHAEQVNAAFLAERTFLLVASNHSQPTDEELKKLLKPIADQIQAIQAFREGNRASKLFTHLSAVSESIPALGWVTVSPKPGPYVKELSDAGTFYTNRVLKDYKDGDKTHVNWARAYGNIWTQLQAYIKEYHTTGVSWKKSGSQAKAATVTSCPSGPRPSACGPPPPPCPPPPPGPMPTSSGGGSDQVNSRSELFAQINQGERIASGLKHISDDQKTHKNPSLRTQAPPVVASSGLSGPKPFTSPKPGAAKAGGPGASPAAAKKHPPLLELEGKKWRVEYHENASNLVVRDTELKQVAYIYQCNNSTVNIKGKINSITVDSCKKLGLVFDNVVGIVELINCKSVQVQVMGTVPTISINKTDGCQIYLSKDSLSCEIVSAKSSEMNVLIPHDKDFKEFPVPEQFKTVWNGKKLDTVATEIAG